MARKWVESRQRGVGGWIATGLFWAWHAAMLGSVAITWIGASAMSRLDPQAPRILGLSGDDLDLLMVLARAWACGAVVLGLFVLAIPGRRVIVEADNAE